MALHIYSVASAGTTFFAMQRHVWRHRDINTLDKGGPDLGLADAAPFTLRGAIEDSRSVATIGVVSGRASIKIGD